MLACANPINVYSISTKKISLEIGQIDMKV